MARVSYCSLELKTLCLVATMYRQRALALLTENVRSCGLAVGSSIPELVPGTRCIQGPLTAVRTCHMTRN